MTQIKEFLRRGLFTVIVLCSAAACSNNDENEDTNYTLDGIQWAMLYDDKVEETIIDVTPEIYENASSSTISVTIDPAMDYEQLSQFYYDDPKYFQLLNQTVNEVSIPTGNLIFDDFRYLSGGQTVPFTLEEYAYLSDNHVEGMYFFYLRMILQVLYDFQCVLYMTLYSQPKSLRTTCVLQDFV